MNKHQTFKFENIAVNIIHDIGTETWLNSTCCRSVHIMKITRVNAQMFHSEAANASNSEEQNMRKDDEIHSGSVYTWMTAESRCGCHVLKCRLDSGPCRCALIWSLIFTLDGYGRGNWPISFTIESGAPHQNMSTSSSFDWPILRSVLEGTNRKNIASCPRTLLLHSFCLWPSGLHTPSGNTNQIRVLLNSAVPLGENAALHSVLLTTVDPQYLRMPSQTHNERKTQHLGAPCRKWGNIYRGFLML